MLKKKKRIPKPLILDYLGINHATTKTPHFCTIFLIFRALCIYIFVHTGIFGGINDLGDGEHNFLDDSLQKCFLISQKKLGFGFLRDPCTLAKNTT